jgi:hypothetical protein
MARILEFPSQRVQGLAFLEEQIRDLLAARGADEELMNFAATTIGEIYQRNVDAENYSFSLTLPDTMNEEQSSGLQQAITDGIEQVRAENHAIIVRLIAELTLAEVRNFQQQRDFIT